MLQTAVPAAGVLSYSLAPGDFLLFLFFILQKRASSFPSYDTLFFFFSFLSHFPFLSLLLSVIHRMAIELLQRRHLIFSLTYHISTPSFFLFPFLFIILISFLALVSVGARLKLALFIYSCVLAVVVNIKFIYIFFEFTITLI